MAIFVKLLHQWYKKINRAQDIEKGRDTLEKEIKKLGIKPNEMLKPEWVQIVLDRYKFPTIDDMYASIGYGGITVNKIIARFLIEYNKETQDEDVDKKIEELANAKGAIHLLGGKLSSSNEFVLPGTEIQRTICIVDKVEPTSKKYPRKAGVPSKQPLK